MVFGRISLEQALNSDNFYQLPKVIIGTKYYSKLKAEAKLLFMLCRDRLSASLDSTRKGDLRFVDNEGDIFIYYSIEDLSEDLGCGRAKVIRLKKELIKYGLIDEVRQGMMKGNRIYVKNVITDIQILNMEFDEAQPLLNSMVPTEVPKSNFKKFQNRTSRNSKTELLEVSKSDSTYIKESKTKKSETKVIISEDDEGKKNNLIRKVDNVSQYDKEYIWELVHDQLENDDYTKSNADYIMINFEKCYKFALENMKYIHSAEQIAEYVFNGLLAEWNKNIRKSQEIAQ